MKRFNFRKFIKRNDFTSVFGGIGKRRLLPFRQLKYSEKQRTMLQMIRRAHQGWRNRVFGMIQALRIRKTYGRRKTISQFIKRFYD